MSHYAPRASSLTRRILSHSRYPGVSPERQRRTKLSARYRLGIICRQNELQVNLTTYDVSLKRPISTAANGSFFCARSCDDVNELSPKVPHDFAPSSRPLADGDVSVRFPDPLLQRLLPSLSLLHRAQGFSKHVFLVFKFASGQLGRNTVFKVRRKRDPKPDAVQTVVRRAAPVLPSGRTRLPGRLLQFSAGLARRRSGCRAGGKNWDRPSSRALLRPRLPAVR